MSEAMSGLQQGYRPRGGAATSQPWPFDPLLVLAVALLVGLGLVIVASASMDIADRNLGSPFHYVARQLVFYAAGTALGWLVVTTPLAQWQRLSGPGLALGFGLLLVVLVVGVEVNGATRWLPLGPVNLQVSEFFKIALLVYIADYVGRRQEEVQTSAGGFFKPLLLLAVAGTLLLAQPDFGAAVVMAATVLGVLFLAGARLWLFAAASGVAAGVVALLVVSAPYRLERVTAFLNPWADPYNSGFQLTQALIAFGRGEWTGVGLGGSVQKLFYLPEAHTDFVFAVIGEELGLIGVLAILALYGLLVVRGLVVARVAEAAGRIFAAYIAYGIALWLGLQVFISAGVNMGVLPTKGLTLPLVSYGGSSVVSTALLLALLLRVDHENRFAQRHRRGRGAWRT
ncbi:cell division protein FtsW [Thiohalospira halophila DSM 15071]|uniref:Probable peptidoglycan glycosyltransferase FtsW n=2 Tax=Thiohalospira halophila TaxID=381300 RepID=A0A1I1R0B0_9GAMM|nr:putative lipid II flippase FtsW [Thiohalospira halophila]SFD24983.1 cell division protein FtsW [Thiohalospira halophila DSM 15071]